MFRFISQNIDALNRSFAAMYAHLERPRAARRVVFGLLLVHSVLLAYCAYVHSPTLNEPGHLVAGLSYWKFGRFDVYNVNPPLVKMVAALPVMAVGYEEDWSGYFSGLGARPEFAMGEDFVAANGERSFFLFMIARWACIPFSWLGGIVCYLWARDLYSRPSGVIACAIWCFEPNILAHASLMTPDAHATSLGLAACYTFWRWLKHPTWTQAIFTGGVLGLAELAKTTLILFYPLWPLLWLIYRWRDRRSMPSLGWLREAGMLAMRMAIGLYVVNLGYGFEGSFTALGEYEFVSKLFAGEADGLLAAEESRPFQPRDSPESATPLLRRNRFSETWCATIPIPLPANYLAGIDLQQRDFENYSRPSYLAGNWRDRGWFYYYVYALAIKVPLGLWGLAALALFFTCNRSRERQRDAVILLVPPLIVLCVVSSKTGFNEHFRYILPCFPFFFIWISGRQFWQDFTRKKIDKGNCNYISSTVADSSGGHCGDSPVLPDRGGGRKMDPEGVPVCRYTVRMISLSFLLWSALSSLWCFPHSLSYFNELTGGPHGGSAHLLGSNLDWGQDLYYLESLLHKSDVEIYTAYLGSFSPIRLCSTIEVTQANVRAAAKPESLYAISMNLLIVPRDPGRGGRPTSSVPLPSNWRSMIVGYAGYSIVIIDLNRRIDGDE